MTNTGYGGLRFDHRFAALPATFYTAMPAKGMMTKPKLLTANPSVAARIGLDSACFATPEFAEIFAGNAPLPGGKPLAMVYSGHQFGVWAGQLGDGRALLLGQVRDANQQLWDIQLKGSGRTPYSRMGDGRAVLRSCVREYLAGIALEGLGVPTTHALCLIGTGSMVQRETPEPGCVLTRIAPSHIRFGHFEHFAHHGMRNQIPLLLDHVINEYFPGLSYREYLSTLATRTAELIGDWQAIGFAHGVMNTDNMSALGFTIDYGPYGFLDRFDLGFICNHSDHQGRYRFDCQPEIAHWNLLALCTALQSMIPWSESQDILKSFYPTLIARYHSRMMAKLGLPSEASDRTLWQDFLMLLQESQADYTLSLRALAEWLRTQAGKLPFAHAEGAEQWLATYRDVLKGYGTPVQIAEAMDRHNPQYILRNWLAEEVIRALEDHDDPAPLHKLESVLAQPFNDHSDCLPWRAPPPAHYSGLAVSCSS